MKKSVIGAVCVLRQRCLVVKRNFWKSLRCTAMTKSYTLAGLDNPVRSTLTFAVQESRGEEIKTQLLQAFSI